MRDAKRVRAVNDGNACAAHAQPICKHRPIRSDHRPDERKRRADQRLTRGFIRRMLPAHSC